MRGLKAGKIDGWSIRGKVCRGVLYHIAKLTTLVGTGIQMRKDVRITAALLYENELWQPVTTGLPVVVVAGCSSVG